MPPILDTLLESVSDISGLTGLSSLETVTLSKCSQLTSLKSLSGNTRPKVNEIHECEALVSDRTVLVLY